MPDNVHQIHVQQNFIIPYYYAWQRRPTTRPSKVYYSVLLCLTTSTNYTSIKSLLFRIIMPDNVHQLHVHQKFIITYYYAWQRPTTTHPTKFYYSILLCLTTSTNYTSNKILLFHIIMPDNVHQLHVQQPSAYKKPEASSAVLGSWWWAVCSSKHVELQYGIIKFWYIVTSCWIFSLWIVLWCTDPRTSKCTGIVLERTNNPIFMHVMYLRCNAGP